MSTLLLGAILPVFVSPLGATITVGIVALLLSLTGSLRLGQWLFGIALLVLWLTATPAVANWLNWQLESQFPPARADTLPTSDALIVLGGILGQPFPPRVAPDLSASSDRIVHALRIYRAKGVPIVISAGNLPWENTLTSEARLIADFFVELGVPRSAVVLETNGRTTRENAVRTAVIFKERGWQHALLVTSGAHMPRALRTFRHVGLDVTPAATDVHAWPPSAISPFELLPDVSALARSTLAIKEMVGLVYYRARGWL
jgi:uncharacterized SAM-binding protein YcdF (DUF218 family)